MYTEPTIVLTERSYVCVYIDGQRYRFYNGKGLGIMCSPNRCRTENEKNVHLQKSYSPLKKLESGWKPSLLELEPVEKTPPIGRCIIDILTKIQEEDLSQLYISDLTKVGEAFVEFLKKGRIDALPATDIQPKHIKEFLQQYKKSGSYYMNKRLTLCGLFSRLVDKEIMDHNPVHQTGRMKIASSLNIPYNDDQLSQVLKKLNAAHRPHQEIRLLTRNNFNADLNRISLSGKRNKSKMSLYFSF